MGNNSKTQTVEAVKTSTREINRQKNRKSKAAAKQEIIDFGGATYLREGVTGAQRKKAKSATNEAIKELRASYKQAFNDIFANEKGFIQQINLTKTQFKKKVTPRMVKNQYTNYQLELSIKALNDEDRGYIKHSPYFVMGAMEKALKGVDHNKLAVELFDCLDSDDNVIDEAGFKKVSAKVMRARAKAKAEAKKKEEQA